MVGTAGQVPQILRWHPSTCPPLRPPTHQAAKPHRLTGSNKAEQSLGTPAVDCCWIYCMYMIMHTSRALRTPNGRNPNAVLKLRPDPSELSRTNSACEMTLCFRRRNAKQMGKCQEPSGPQEWVEQELPRSVWEVVGAIVPSLVTPHFRIQLRSHQLPP